eukprot:gene1829-16319_t
MRDLLRFQQRNEKMIGKLESDFAKELHASKLQEKMMALMHLKAMEAQKNKQKQNKPDQKKKPDEKKKPEEKKKPKSKQQPKGFFDKTLGLPNIENLQENENVAVNNFMKPKPHLLTGVLSNGLKTIVEDHSHVMHVGPTVKIVENKDGSGFIYKTIEVPPVSKQMKAAANNRGHYTMMHHGNIGKIPVNANFEQDEFSNPMDLVQSHSQTGKAELALRRHNPPQRNEFSSRKTTSATFDPITGGIIETEDSQLVQGKIPLKQNSLLNTRGNFARKTSLNLRKNTKAFTMNNKARAQQHGIRPNTYGKNSRFNGKQMPVSSRQKSIKQYKASSQKVNVAGLNNLPVMHFTAKRPQPSGLQPHPMPSSLLKMINSKNQLQNVGRQRFAMQFKPKLAPPQHKLPESLARMLQARKSKPVTAQYNKMKPNLFLNQSPPQQEHKLPESLLKILKSRGKHSEAKPLIKSPLTASTFAKNQHQIPESLRRILSSNNAKPTAAMSLDATTKQITKKPYTITLAGHKVPYSLFKMLTEEAVSGKDPKVSSYLMKTPFKFVQEHHVIPESLQRILKGSKKNMLDKSKFHDTSSHLVQNKKQKKTPLVSGSGRNRPKTVTKTVSQYHRNQVVSPFAALKPTRPQIVAPYYGQQLQFQEIASNNKPSLNLETYNFPASAITRTTVASRNPNSPPLSSVDISPRIKGPSFSKTQIQKEESKKIVIKTMEMPTPSSYDPLVTSYNRGKLLSIDTEKDKEG